MFKKATKKKTKLKLAITGPSGSGKTYSALRLATGLKNGCRIAYIDTENESASLYSDRFDFDVLDLTPPFDHEKFVEAIRVAVNAGYDCVIIDSASHFWEGILEYKSKLDARGGNSYTNWNEAGKKFKEILDSVLQSKIHVICCLRSKMDYILETNDKGKKEPRKVGLAPIMRDGIEYEFTTVFDVALDHHANTSKDRTGMFTDKIFQITEQTGKQIAEWLESGEDTIKEKTTQATELPIDLESLCLESNITLEDVKSYLQDYKQDVSNIHTFSDINPKFKERLVEIFPKFLKELSEIKDEIQI